MSLETFTAAYIGCALWSSSVTDVDDVEIDLTAHEMAPECRSRMEADCASFYAENGDHMEDDEQGGHDFWLTRCGHGAGFWDGDWPDAVATLLTTAAVQFGNVDLYIGDDGLIHA